MGRHSVCAVELNSGLVVNLWFVVCAFVHSELVTSPPLLAKNKRHPVINKAFIVLENRERYMMLIVIILLIVAFMTYIALSPTAAPRMLQHQHN